MPKAWTLAPNMNQGPKAVVAGPEGDTCPPGQGDPNSVATSVLTTCSPRMCTTRAPLLSDGDFSAPGAPPSRKGAATGKSWLPAPPGRGRTRAVPPGALGLLAGAPAEHRSGEPMCAHRVRPQETGAEAPTPTRSLPGLPRPGWSRSSLCPESPGVVEGRPSGEGVGAAGAGFAVRLRLPDP